MTRRGKTRLLFNNSSEILTDAVDIPITKINKRKKISKRIIDILRTKTQYSNLDDVSLYRIASEMIKRKTFNMKRRINTGNLKPNFKLK